MVRFTSVHASGTGNGLSNTVDKDCICAVIAVKAIDFEHILMYINIRKRDNVKAGVPLPIKKVEH